MKPEQAMQKAIQIVGRSNLARALKISPQAISQWKRVPAKRVKAVERLTKHQVLAAEMRPDIFESEHLSSIR
ncbi:transcriptional regulator [Oceanospirillum sediminis]|uniref:Helix-turn-helix domain-containing protein n=1 Tax=Oceanospirillum sediminis TaxID=2760088 RepID=A0A839IKS7_9GAMM|nr:Cro/CI family transcriptional regulator [Oceanospirillum sediminis]MBB1485805.1 helix-turn-helix domain-containing protein [Oceanospirillum sediminis]